MKSFRIPGKVESLNKLHGMHWAARRRYNQTWFAKMVLAAGRNHTPAKGKRWVTFTVSRARRLDFTNMVGGLKPVEDGLTKLGWIENDTPDLIQATYNQRLCKKGSDCVDIEIREPGSENCGD